MYPEIALELSEKCLTAKIVETTRNDSRRVSPVGLILSVKIGAGSRQ